MAQVMQFEFRLFGPRKGQTININGHRFVNGMANLIQSQENMGSCMRVLSFYGAFARGTAEYDAAVAAEEAENGANEVPEASIEGANKSAPTGVQPDGRGSAEETADVGGGDAGTEGSNGSGSNPDGNGREHAGVPKFPEDKDRRTIEPPSEVDVDVAAAVKKLDPEVDAHWVMTGAHKGKPKLNAVEEAYGKAGLTRQDVEAAVPGWDRDKALEVALAA